MLFLQFFRVLLIGRRVFRVLRFDSLVPEAGEGVLATSLNFKSDALSILNGRGDAHVDRAGHGRAWLIEGSVHSDLHIALATMCFFVFEKLHVTFYLFIYK